MPDADPARVAADQAAQLPGKREEDKAWATAQIERVAQAIAGHGYSVRQRSANGLPPQRPQGVRSCRRCHADFVALAPGKTGLRGLWSERGGWWCSQECYDIDHSEAPDA